MNKILLYTIFLVKMDYEGKRTATMANSRIY
jgi:hypothetical protein